MLRNLGLAYAAFHGEGSKMAKISITGMQYLKGPKASFTCSTWDACAVVNNAV